MISGADEPRAMRDRLATVGFQNRLTRFLPETLSVVIVTLLVICSIASMKRSAMIATPRKHQPIPNR